MADYVNPYRTALASYFPNKTGQEYKQDPSKVTHYLIYLNQVGPLDQWLHPDPSKMFQTKVSERVNDLVTDKKLHPLHLCAMLNQEKMAVMLLETKVCQVDPQDYLEFTPLHHAAVNNFQNMIALFIKYGANQNLTNSRQGTYLEVLNLVHPSIDPLKQTFYYKDTQTGDIVQGNGLDFQQYTGAETFLDKEPVMSVNEAVNEWATIHIQDDPGTASLVPVMQKAYKQFREHPPLLYLEKREGLGVNVCANEDIQPGTIVAEYLTEIKRNSQDKYGPDTYIFAQFNGEKKRGIGALINDGFPNCITFTIINTKGVTDRIALCATTRISKGSSIVYNYGVGHTIKFNLHRELCDEIMSDFFKKKYNRADSLSLIKEFGSQKVLIENMTKKNASASSYDSFNKLLYLATTPHAMIKLVCDQTISIEAVLPFDKALSYYATDYPLQMEAMRLVVSTVQLFSDALKKIKKEEAQERRETVLKNLSNMNVDQLLTLLESLAKT